MMAPATSKHSRSKGRKVDTPLYEERYLAFIDILGFASIVEKSRLDAALVLQINQALSGISKRAQSTRSTKLGLEAASFSDTIVLSLPATLPGLFHLFEMLDGFSVDLLSMNMLFRGAVVRGLALHTAEVIYGPAVLEAYKLESSVSFHPRIMISRPVLDDVRRFPNQALIDKYVIVDGHDVPYLNPFAQWHEDHNTPLLLKRLVQLQTIIATGLLENGNQPSICEKYKWLARKLNNFISKVGLQDKIMHIALD